MTLSARVAEETADELKRLRSELEQAADDNDAACRLHQRAAQILLTLPDETSQAEALDHLRAGWAARPGDNDTLTMLVSCLESSGDDEALVALYREAASQAEPSGRALLLLQAAEAACRIGHIDEALSIYEQLLALGDAVYGGEVAKLENRITALLGQHDPSPEQVAIVEQLGRFADQTDAFDRLVTIAKLRYDAGDVEPALSCYRQALVLRPDDDRALQPLRLHLLDTEQDEALVDLLQSSAANATSAKVRADLWREAAEVAEQKLGDFDRAANAWWHAWEANRGDEVPNLKRIYTELQQWDSYVKVLRAEVQRAGEVDKKVDVYHELATLQREVLGDDRAAAATYRLILQLQPGDNQALRGQLAICEDKKLGDGTVRALARCARHAPSKSERDELLRRLCRMELARGHTEQMLRAIRQLDANSAANRELLIDLRGKCEQPYRRRLDALLLTMQPAPQLLLEISREYADAGERGQAADLCRHVIERVPDHAAARTLLTELEQELNPAASPAEVLRERAEAAADREPELAIRLLVQAAQVAAHADQSELSQQLLQRALELFVPTEMEITTLTLLETALREAKMFAALAELLSTAADQVEQDTRRCSLLKALSVILREELDEPLRAVEALEQARALEPDRRLLTEVIAMHRELGNHAAMAAALEEAIAATDEHGFLEELAKLYAEQLEEPAAAFRHYSALLDQDPSHTEALAFCRAHEERNGDHRSVVVRLGRAAEITDDLAARGELHREIAEIAEQKLDDLDFAITHWRKVAEAFPGDGVPRAELKRLLRLAGRFEEVEAVLLSDVSRSIPEEKIPLYLDLATLAGGKLHNQRAAAAYLRNALQLGPDNREVMSRLEALYEETGQWRELAMVLRRHAEVVRSLDKRVGLLLRAAHVLLNRLSRDEEALAVCRRVRELRPAERNSAAMMREIYIKRQRWQQLLALLQDQISHETDNKALGGLHLEVGRLLMEQLRDAEAAATHFEMALEADAGRGDVLPLLRQIYSTMGRWDLLAELIRRRSTSDELSPTERAATLCEIGHINEQQLNDLDAAWAAYEQAIQLVPEYRPALAALRALAMVRQQWRDAVAVGRRELALIEEQDDRARLLVDLADILQHQLSRPKAAAEALEEAREADPSNIASAERLATIYFDEHDWENAGRFLEEVVNSGVELESLHEFFYRLGYACERLGKEEQAFGHYVKSFGREPLYLPTLNRLVELCYQRNQWDNTLRIAEAIIETYANSKSTEELAELHVRFGLCKLHLAQREIALLKLQAMVLPPNGLPHTERSAWEEVADCWAATPLERQLLSEVSADVLTEVIAAMDHALTCVPNHVDALQVLAALTVCRGDWERSLRYIERAVESSDLDRRACAGLLIGAGDISAQHLGSPQRAETYFRRALTALPGSTQARRRLERLNPSATQESPRSKPRAKVPTAPIVSRPPPPPSDIPPPPPAPSSAKRPAPPAPPAVPPPTPEAPDAENQSAEAKLPPPSSRKNR